MRCRRSAFTLTELLVSIVFLSLAVPALCMMVNAGMEAVFENGARSEAFNLARNEIEKCLNISYDTLKDEVPQDEYYTVSRRVTLIAGSSGHSGGVKRITVAVTRRRDGKEIAALTTDITGDHND